jgi:hypothetical protein
MGHGCPAAAGSQSAGGCQTWDLVAADLAGRGYQVGVPDLTGTVAAGPPYCSRQAAVIAGSAAGEPAILIGHSGAGPLLAAAGALIGQACGYVFADAGLPAPGQSWMETVPPGLATQLRLNRRWRATSCTWPVSSTPETATGGPSEAAAEPKIMKTPSWIWVALQSAPIDQPATQSGIR